MSRNAASRSTGSQVGRRASEHQRFSRLLIVEDDAAQLHTLTRIMQAEGFEVVGCQSAAAALAQVQRLELGVAIIDLCLPDLDGVQLVEHIRALNPAVRLIIHTGYGSFESAKALLNLGAFAYVEKLSDPQELVQYVHRAMHESISQYAGQLEAVVAEHTRELRQAYDELERRVEARTSELQHSQALLNSIINNTPAAIYVKELDGRFLLINRQYERLFNVTLAEVRGRTVYDFFPKDTADTIEANNACVLAAGTALEFEEIYRQPDGLHTYLSFNAPLYNAAGQPYALCGISTDITEHTQAEQRLRRQTEALMALWKANIFEPGRFQEALRELTRVAARTLQVARVSVWLFNEERSNITCLNLYELQADRHSAGHELTAAVYPAYFCALEESRTMAADDAHTDPRTCEFSAHYLAPHGITSMLDAPLRLAEGLVGVLCHEHVGPRRRWSPEEQVFAGSLADLVALAVQTEKRFRAEEALHASEQRLELALHGADIGLWDYNVQAGEMVIDERGAERVRRVPDETHFQIDAWKQGIHPDDLPGWSRAVRACLDGTAPAYEAEFRLRMPSGEWRWVHARGKVVAWDTDGTPLRAAGTHLDITASKRLEQQFLQAQKLEAVGRLAGGIAHDFNNLLTAILGYSELVINDLSQVDQSRAWVEEIHKAGQRAAMLTRQLLAFSRKQVLMPIVLDLNVVVRDMDAMLRRLIGEDIILVLALDPVLRQVKVDPGQMEQVLMNLVVNARDAMPSGGQLAIETGNVDLDLTYAPAHPEVQPGPYAMLTVIDTGCGMDAVTQARLFEPFFTTKEPGKGTGLGLATVFGIVKQSGGHIEVSSAVGQGTTFKVYLPQAADTQVSPPVRPMTLEASLYGTETVLLVEDEAQIRSLARSVLEQAGYTVLEAQNGQEALHVCTQHQGPIHLLITDVIMPGMSGGQLGDQITILRPTIQVLFMSGYTGESLAHHGVLAPGKALLEKPFTPVALMRKAREVLQGLCHTLSCVDNEPCTAP